MHIDVLVVVWHSEDVLVVVVVWHGSVAPISVVPDSETVTLPSGDTVFSVEGEETSDSVALWEVACDVSVPGVNIALEAVLTGLLGAPEARVVTVDSTVDNLVTVVTQATVLLAPVDKSDCDGGTPETVVLVLLITEIDGVCNEVEPSVLADVGSETSLPPLSVAIDDASGVEAEVRVVLLLAEGWTELEGVAGC